MDVFDLPQTLNPENKFRIVIFAPFYAEKDIPSTFLAPRFKSPGHPKDVGAKYRSWRQNLTLGHPKDSPRITFLSQNRPKIPILASDLRAQL